jgi:hypothetical protein
MECTGVFLSFFLALFQKRPVNLAARRIRGTLGNYDFHSLSQRLQLKL